MKPQSSDEFIKWSDATTCGVFSKHTQTWYETAQNNLFTGLQESEFVAHLPRVLDDAAAAFRNEHGAQLFALGLTPTLTWNKKSYASFVEKLFRRNCVDNDQFPTPPGEGWASLEAAFAVVDDVVRATIYCAYADGVSFLAQRIAAGASSNGIKVSQRGHAKEKGYYAHHIYLPFLESDLDGDGLTDALIESSACSSYVQPTYFFVAGTMGDRFVAQELESGVNLTVETWRGRPAAVLESNNEGYNQARPESVSRRFVFERGRAIMVDEQRAVELVALANLRSEEFDFAKPNQEKILRFDLDGDGRKDAIVGTLWQRWGRIMWQVRFADGRVSDGGNSGCKRLGVLAEKTMGYRDLVCDFGARIQWDGRGYAPRVEK